MCCRLIPEYNDQILDLMNRSEDKCLIMLKLLNVSDNGALVSPLAGRYIYPFVWHSGANVARGRYVEPTSTNPQNEDFSYSIEHPSGIHVFTDFKEVEDNFERWRKIVPTLVLVQVKCYLDDFVRAEDGEIDYVPFKQAVFKRVYLDEDEYKKAIQSVKKEDK